MDINELLKYLNSQSNQPIGTSIGNEALHATVNTNPTLRGDITAMQPTDAGLLSATIGKELNQPSFKDYALTRDDMRYGVINQKGDNMWGLFSGVTKYTTHSYSKGDNTETKMFGGVGNREREIFTKLVELV
jgi:hypothetical protein